MIHYALIDAVNTPDLFEIIERYNPPVACLYNEPLEPEMKAVAPFLMELNQEVLKEWLAYHKEPWGICLTSDATLSELRKHLRKFTYAKIPIHETPVLFRYYDPRTIWDFVNTVDDWTLHTFLGPIDMISTLYEGEFRYDLFEERRKKYPKGGSMGSPYITLTEAQYEMLDKIAETKYIQVLSSEIQAFIDPELLESMKVNQQTEPYFVNQMGRWYYVNQGLQSFPIIDERLKDLNIINESRITEHDFHKMTKDRYRQPSVTQVTKEETLTYEAIVQKVNYLAEDLYHFCQSHDIRDSRSMRSIGGLLVTKGIYNFKDLPKSWHYALTRTDYTGSFRAEHLVITELGYMPE